MTEPDRVLRPLREAEPAIDQLESYESPAVLLEALRATWHAVELTLRTLLRSAAAAPDDVRMTALSHELMPTENLLAELRRRDLIPLELAGRLHEFQHALRRAGDSGARAADADVALAVVALVRDAVSKSSPLALVHSPLSTFHAPPAIAAATPRRPLYVLALVAALLAAAVALVYVFGGPSSLEQGIAAFTEGRQGVAEQHFRDVLERDADNVTAALYLARILRGQGRSTDAAGLLRATVRGAPQDPAVRRELGYLFLDLDAASSAVEQFETAVELEPGEPLNWVSLVQALRLARDSAAADEWLRRAPAAARAMIETGRD